VEKASDVRAGMLNRDMAIDLWKSIKKYFGHSAQARDKPRRKILYP
jgi:hypothetical protein